MNLKFYSKITDELMFDQSQFFIDVNGHVWIDTGQQEFNPVFRPDVYFTISSKYCLTAQKIV